MRELIKIEAQIIGAKELNTVNARDLHKGLEIKKDFTNWIKSQINRAGLQENVDYIISTVSSNGGRPQKDYIITTNASKHIAMMSQGKKAQEVRDYFIAVEEEFKSQLQTPTPPTDINLVLLDMLKNQQRQTDALLDLTASVVKLVENKTVVPKMNVVQLEGSRKLDSVEKYTLRNAVQIIAVKLSKRHGVSKSSIIPGIWVKLKEHFEVFDYSDLKSEQLMVIGGWLDEYDIVDHSKGFIVAEGAIPMKEES